MEDKWKEIFRENKGKIQEDFPVPDGHESRFLAKLNTKNNQQSSPSFNFWKVAAILIPLLMLATYFVLEFNPKTSEQPNSEVLLANYSQDLNEADNQLSFIVQQKIEEVKSLQTPENKQFIHKSLQGIENLQKDYNRLLIDLNQSGGNSQVVRSILLNLQLQVELLENVLVQIETIQEFKTTQNETI